MIEVAEIPYGHLQLQIQRSSNSAIAGFSVDHPPATGRRTPPQKTNKMDTIGGHIF